MWLSPQKSPKKFAFRPKLPWQLSGSTLVYSCYIFFQQKFQKNALFVMGLGNEDVDTASLIIS